MTTYSPEQIMAALAACPAPAYTSSPDASKPMTTSQIGFVVREHHGDQVGYGGSSADVMPGLRKLVADGKLVTSLKATGRTRLRPMETDDEYRYITESLPTRVSTAERVWATPDVAKAWRAHLDEKARHMDGMQRLADAVKDALPDGKVKVVPTRTKIYFDLSPDAAQKTLALLRIGRDHQVIGEGA